MAETTAEHFARVSKAIDSGKFKFPETLTEIPEGQLQRTQPYEGGLTSSFKEGFGRGSIGTFSGADYQPQSLRETFPEKIAGSTGKILSDLPAISAGVAVAGLPGAFALPAAIESAKKEYESYNTKDLNLRNILKSVGTVAKDTGKGAVLGGVMKAASVTFPFLKHLPGLSKVMSTRTGKVLVEGAIEATTLTAGGSALEGKMPTLEDFAHNAVLVTGLKGISSSSEYIRSHPKLQMLRRDVRERAEHFERIKDHVGEIGEKNIEKQFARRDILEEVQKKGEFTLENREDMLYWRQRTGNPKIKDDTSGKLSKRLPEHAKEYVDTHVDKYFEDTLKEYNDDPNTGKINPRSFIEETFLPGLYKYDKKAFAKAASMVKTKAPAEFMKQFPSYFEAFEKAGLEPKYKSITELMDKYDSIMNKTRANAKLLKDVNELEVGGKKLIVQPSDAEAYRNAKNEGYVAFDDPLLKEGEPGSRSEKPVLIDKNLAPSLKGVFNVRRPLGDNAFWKGYDNASNTVRMVKVMASPFHFIPLTESWFAQRGFNLPSAKKGRVLRGDVTFMKRAARSLLQVGNLENVSKANNFLSNTGNFIYRNVKNAKVRRTFDRIGRFGKYLFEEYHPNLKAQAFDEVTKEEHSIAAKKLKRDLTPTEKLDIDKIVAKTINDNFGGQPWETMQFFNDPKNLKATRRLVSFPDWSISAIRQASNLASTGLRGKLAAKYWAQAAVVQTAFVAALRGFYGGFYEDKNKKVKYSMKRALDKMTTFEKDPTKLGMAQLPEIPGWGIDEEGRRLYTHPGKQYREVAGWGTGPVATAFSKSNFIFQAIYKQLVGTTPSKDGTFPVRAKQRLGDFKSWDASKPSSLERYISRGKQLLEDLMLPFTGSALLSHGIKPVIATGAALPVSKGMSLRSSTPYIEKYVKGKHYKKLDEIKKTLHNNGYTWRSIKQKVGQVRSQLRKERLEKRKK